MMCPWCRSHSLCAHFGLQVFIIVFPCVTVTALSSPMLLVFKLELQHNFKCLCYGFHAIFMKSPVNKK